MNRYCLNLVSFVCLAVVLNCVLSAHADCRRGSFRANQVRHIQVNQQQHEVQLAVPFAVPVAVPVATISPYFYGTSALYGNAASGLKFAHGLPGLDRREAPALGARSPVAGASPPHDYAQPAHSLAAPAPATQTSALTRHCLACHGPLEPRGQLSLSSPQLLSPENRLAAIRAVMAGRMPQGSKLSAEELRAVLAELCQP